MNETPHPAVVARRRRLQQLRVRIAGGVVGLFIALSVIYVQTPSTAKVATASTRASTSTSTSSTSSSTTSSSAATPMTTSQS